MLRQKVCVYLQAYDSPEAKAIMKTWIANYEGNEIRVEKTWLGLEKLFVNNKIQDENSATGYAFSSGLTGHLILKSGEKKSIKVRFASGCRLFIDDEIVEVVKTS